MALKLLERLFRVLLHPFPSVLLRHSFTAEIRETALYREMNSVVFASDSPFLYLYPVTCYIVFPGGPVDF